MCVVCKDDVSFNLIFNYYNYYICPTCLKSIKFEFYYYILGNNIYFDYLVLDSRAEEAGLFYVDLIYIVKRLRRVFVNKFIIIINSPVDVEFKGYTTIYLKITFPQM